MNKQRTELLNQFISNDGEPSFSEQKNAALTGCFAKAPCSQSRRDLSAEPGYSRSGAKYLSVFLAIVFLLSACGSKPTTATSIPLPTDTPIKKYPVLPTLTPIKIPSPTISPTGTITPIPTIATFTPTFDARTIVTVTPAAVAVCPRINQDLNPDLGLPEKLNLENPFIPGIVNKILEFLNNGGTYEKLNDELSRYYARTHQRLQHPSQDLTGDSIPEIIIIDANVISTIHVLSCQEGKYVDFVPVSPAETAWPVGLCQVFDLNRNSIPELLLSSGPWWGIYEWDGNGFRLLNPNMRETGAVKIDFRDTDNNGFKEIVVLRYIPPMWDEIQEWPWRPYTDTYTWNGSEFTLSSKEFNAPIYRFQAIQDADQYVLNGKYDKAILSYQDAIFKNELQWWSPERREYEITLDELSKRGTPTPTLPTPAPDTTESPRLAAYAYYRMIALHVYLGEMDAATVQYSTLRQKFPAGDPGHPYVEMATAFWDAYQSSANMTTACAAAIQYAAEHPEILVALGSDYHGWQSHIYVPADVCPFR